MGFRETEFGNPLSYNMNPPLAVGRTSGACKGGGAGGSKSRTDSCPLPTEQRVSEAPPEFPKPG